MYKSLAVREPIYCIAELADFEFVNFDTNFESTGLIFPLVVQVVQDILPPVPLDIPMSLIKPQEACSTAEVYKVKLF